MRTYQFQRVAAKNRCARRVVFFFPVKEKKKEEKGGEGRRRWRGLGEIAASGKQRGQVMHISKRKGTSKWLASVRHLLMGRCLLHSRFLPIKDQF